MTIAPSPNRDRLRTGELLGGEYRIEAILAEGESSVVYSAITSKASRVAVKVARGVKAPTAHEVFARLRKAANDIDHPSAVRVHDIGAADDGAPYIVRDFVDGETVLARWERAGRRMRVAEVLAIADQLLDLMIRAHAAGANVGRVDPSELMIDERGCVRVLAWGIGEVSPREELRTLGIMAYLLLTGDELRGLQPPSNTVVPLPVAQWVSSTTMDRNVSNPANAVDVQLGLRRAFETVIREPLGDAKQILVPRTLHLGLSTAETGGAPPSRAKLNPGSVTTELAGAGSKVAEDERHALTGDLDGEISQRPSGRLGAAGSDGEPRLVVGSMFAGYRIDECVGRGGMGEVYRAWDPSLHRDVAIKIVLDSGRGEERADANDRVRRLQREARSAAAIAHTNVIAVYDVGNVGTTAFIAMEFVRGSTLRALLSRDQLDTQEGLRILISVGRALDAAHRKGIVHRDVKPENIMIADDGVVKVLDFGIAKPFVTTNAAHEQLTAAQVVVGSPRYMAPEQLHGEPLDGRADQFAWGVVACEVLARQPPWAFSGQRLVRAILTEPPSASVLGRMTGRLRAVVERSLEKEPAARFPAFLDLISSLQEATDQPLDVGSARSSPPLTQQSLNAGVLDRGAPTRTSTAIAASIAMPTRSIWRTWMSAPIGIALLAGTAGLIAAKGRAHTLGLPSPPPVSSARLGLDRPSRETNPQSLAKFTAGIQLWKDAAAEEAREAFEQAIEADSSLASAHLRYIMLTGQLWPATREHYAQAMRLRALLSEDERLVLDAFAPVMGSPSDLAETERRLSAIGETWPDPLLLVTIAARRMRLGADSATIEAADHALKYGGEIGAAWMLRATAQTHVDNIDAARTDLLKCLTVAPQSGSCFEALARLEASEGNCDELTDLSRKWIAATPNRPEPYAFFAGALLQTTGSIEGARDALEQRWARLSPSSRPASESEEQMALALWSGDFGFAEARLDEWEKAVASSSDGRARGLPAVARMELYLELGRRDEAGRLARSYLERNRAWMLDRSFDVRINALRVLRETHAISTDQFEHYRQTWKDESGSDYGTPARIWFNFFAVPSVTPEDAARAMTELPSYKLFDRVTRGAACDLSIGRVNLRAGKTADAIGYFRRAERSCHLTDAMERVQATLFLGNAFEALSDKQNACDAYGRVLKAWGRAPRSVSATAARSRSVAIGCTIYAP